MNSTIDFSSIAQAALASARTLLDRWLPGGRFTGDNYVVRNPTRIDETPGSFSINAITGEWADFATPDKGGDLISLYAYINGISQGEAAKQLSAMLLPVTAAHTSRPSAAPTNPETPDILLDPIPDNAPSVPEFRPVRIDGKWIHYDIKYYWAYRDQIGNIRFYVVRYETPDGKETPPMTLWKKCNGQMKWRFKGISEKRPVFNLNKIAHSPDAQVIVVEGEKKADLLQAMIENADADAKLVATCWVGGVNGASKTDWNPLHDRKIILWPDHDKVGVDAMVEVMSLIGNSSEFIMLKISDDKPPAWDVADAIETDHWAMRDILDFIKATRFKPELPLKEPDQEPPSTDPPPEELLPVEIDKIKFPFRCLGYDGEFHYYLPDGTRQVRAIKSEAHNAGTLMALAPLPFWERNYPSKQGPLWRYAANALMRQNELMGVFSPNRQRGRGAWYDNGRSVLHLGNRLLVDGVEMPIEKIESRFIYEASPELETINVPALGIREANRLQQISDMLFWEKPIYGKLLSGWIVCAAICGALKHRPHIWITSPPGGGKTFVIEEIINPLLGEFALDLASETTEAGIRQTLKNDALAVVIDEFEGEDFFSQTRVQNVLKLARLAFSDNGSRLVKGGQSHKATSFQIRSCFCMSSVGVNLYQHADETRVSVLSLFKPFDRDGMTKEAHFNKLSQTVASTLTTEWCAAFRARAIKMIPVIKKNTDIFERVVGGVIGNRRSGDQVGPLLASAYSLCSDKIITEKAAIEWINAQDWSDQHAVADNFNDNACLNSIMESTIKKVGSNDEISIIELLNFLMQFNAPNLHYDDTEEAQMLVRCGIKLERDDAMVWISNSHIRIKKLLHGTPWEKSWSRALKRVGGAICCNRMRFLGPQTAAVGVPWAAVTGNEEINQPISF